MDIKRQINMCIFMSMMFTLIEITFDIDINSDELLIIIWEHNKKERKLIPGKCIAMWSPSLKIKRRKTLDRRNGELK